MTQHALPMACAVALFDPLPSAVLAFPARGCPTVQPVRPALSDAERDELNRLRWFALKSALAPRPDFERACFLLAGDDDVSLERSAIAFFRALSAKSLFDMSFYRPGAKAASDDEIWLLRLLEAWRAGNDAAAGALVAWRVRPEARRWLRFLSARFAKAL
ncbi:hypothetical protein [Aurantimonas sp. Leaf443]|uniref:hypothetical protein n=1 Tax=Aurantimonas sp. Leaf443 TaxID=1736378 RepID=UPI0006F4950E|nr:hypothetical protein [Aurantimonas sp. Leaf443]KQT88193.1 hypothetical protein ASG48_01775 [Aurantimonas sp. Leaf443]